MDGDCPVTAPTSPESSRSFAARTSEDLKGTVHVDADGRHDAVGVRIEDQSSIALPLADPGSSGSLVRRRRSECCRSEERAETAARGDEEEEAERDGAGDDEECERPAKADHDVRVTG
jgi:hypothetical protein